MSEEIEGVSGIQVEIVNEVIIILLLYEGKWIRPPGLGLTLNHRQVVLEKYLKELPRPIFEGSSTGVIKSRVRLRHHMLVLSPGLRDLRLKVIEFGAGDKYTNTIRACSSLKALCVVNVPAHYTVEGKDCQLFH